MSLLCQRRVLWILFLALAVRLVAVGLAVGWEQPPSDKSLRYDPIARSLLAGEGFALNGAPTAASPPIYPLLLAAVYGVAGESPTALRFVLAILDTLHCAVWIVIAWSLLGRRIALLTGFSMAVCPYFLYMIVTAGNDGPYLLLHAIFVAVLIGAWREMDMRNYAAAGVAAGAVTLCRPVSLFEPFFLALLLVLGSSRDRKRSLRGAAWMLLLFVLTLTPWTVRNWVHFGRLVPIQTLGGYTLVISNFDRGDPRVETEIAKGTEGRNTRAKRDAGMLRHGLNLVLDDPGAFAGRCARRLVTMWYSTHSRPFNPWLALGNTALLTAAGVGFIRLRRRWRDLLPVLATTAYFITFHSLLFVIFRYMLPVVPVLIMLAAAAVQPRSELARTPGPNADIEPDQDSPSEASERHTARVRS